MPDTVAESWNMRCPKCGSDEEIRIQCTTWVDLLPEGTDNDGDHVWDEKSPAYCGACDYGADENDKVTVADFNVHCCGDECRSNGCTERFK